MQKIPILIFFLLQLQSALGSAEVNDVAVSYYSGRSSSSTNCSGSFVTSNSKRYFISASHCFKDLPKKKIHTYIYKHRSNKRDRSSKVSIDFSKEHYFNRAGDTVFKEIPQSTRLRTNELILSNKLPSLGDQISVLGYPIKKSKRIATKLSCIFLGSTVYQTPVNPKGIGRILKCKTSLKSVIGISGGPVINDAGEFIGTTSAQILPAKDYEFKGERFIYLIYNEVTRELLESNKMQRVVINFIKMSPGKYIFLEADEALYLKPSMYQISN